MSSLTFSRYRALSFLFAQIKGSEIQNGMVASLKDRFMWNGTKRFLNYRERQRMWDIDLDILLYYMYNSCYELFSCGDTMKQEKPKSQYGYGKILTCFERLTFCGLVCALKTIPDNFISIVPGTVWCCQDLFLKKKDSINGHPESHLAALLWSILFIPQYFYRSLYLH